MAKALDKQVEALLQEGMSKETIFKKLQTTDNSAKLVFFLNNKSLLVRRKSYMWINLLLSAMLLAMTLKRLLAISASRHFDFLLLFDFIVPTIHFYILRELLLFHRTGYQFLAVLTALGLLYEQNRVMPDIIVNICMILLAAFLYVKMFPKEELLSLKR